VSELWRYPVKSLLGERLRVAEVESRGPTLDRRWAIYGADGKIGSGKSTRRFRRMPGLLDIASHGEDGSVHVRFPDGHVGPVPR
jgi:uncharacterized protein YcbX